MGVVADVDEGSGVEDPVSEGAESDGAAAAGTAAGTGVVVGVDAAGAGETVPVPVPVPVSASAGTADNAPAGKMPASAIARAAAARTIGWNFGVFTGLPYLPSFAKMAASSPEVTPWRHR